MELSSEHNELDLARGPRSGGAGLRIRPTEAEPTGLFVAVEMTVLVIVAALAMVSIIVSSDELAERDPAVTSIRHVDSSTRLHVQAAQTAREAVHVAERRQPVDGTTSR